MTPIYLNDFYQLGSFINQLRLTLLGNITGNRNSKYDLTIGVLKTIEKITLRNDLDESMTNAISNLIQKLQTTSLLNNQLPPNEAKNVYDRLLEWQAMIKLELDYITCYNFDHDTTLNIAKLEEDGAEGFFGTDVWTNLSDIVKHDLDESAKGLIFGLSTASGIMALRGLEDIVRQYHKHITKSNVSGKTWGELINDIEKQNSKSPILGYLKYLKDEKRNPLNHPEMTLTAHEAEAIFFMVKDAIIKIAGEMKTL